MLKQRNIQLNKRVRNLKDQHRRYSRHNLHWFRYIPDILLHHSKDHWQRNFLNMNSPQFAFQEIAGAEYY